MMKLGPGVRAGSTPLEAPRDLLAWWPAVSRHPFPFLLDGCGVG